MYQELEDTLDSLYPITVIICANREHLKRRTALEITKKRDGEIERARKREGGRVWVILRRTALSNCLSALEALCMRSLWVGQGEQSYQEPECGQREARGYKLKGQGGWTWTEGGEVRGLNPLKTDRNIRLERVVTLQKRENKNRESQNAMSVALRVRAWIWRTGWE